MDGDFFLVFQWKISRLIACLLSWHVDQNNNNQINSREEKNKTANLFNLY